MSIQAASSPGPGIHDDLTAPEPEPDPLPWPDWLEHQPLAERLRLILLAAVSCAAYHGATGTDPGPACAADTGQQHLTLPMAEAYLGQAPGLNRMTSMVGSGAPR